MNGKNDKVCGLIGMLIAGALLFASIDIGKIENQTIGADFVPKLVGVLLFVLSGILFLNGMKSSSQPSKDSFPRNYKGTLLMVFLLILYVLMFDVLGFIVSSMIYLFAALLLLTKPSEVDYKKFVAISVVGAIVIDLLFTQVFGINLPAGLLG